MSEGLLDAPVMDAPAEQQAPAIPAGSLLGGLGNPTPTEQPVTPATETPPAGPSEQQAFETPYFAKLVADNPELKQYESTLAHFQKPVSADEFAKETAKGYAEAVKFKGILVPEQEAAEKDVATYRKVNGIPSEPSGFKFGETLGDQFKALGINDPAWISKYEASAHKNNVTAGQFAGIMADHAEIVKELSSGLESQSTAIQTANISALKEGWGEKANAYLGDAQKLHDVAFVGAELTESEQKDMEKFIGTTAYTKLLHSLGQRIPKETMIHNGAAAVFQSSASKFQQVSEAMAKDPKHPVLDATHPNHEVELERFIKLERESRGVF